MGDQINLTARELASRWDLPQRTLGQWRWRGKGPVFIKLGRHISYSVKDVESFEQEQRRRNTCKNGSSSLLEQNLSMKGYDMTQLK